MDKKIIDGKIVSEKIRGQIKNQVDDLKNQSSAIPGLAAVLVGEDGPSQIYVRNKRKACENVGIYSEEHKLPEKMTGELYNRVLGEGSFEVLNIARKLGLPPPFKIEVPQVKMSGSKNNIKPNTNSPEIA